MNKVCHLEIVMCATAGVIFDAGEPECSASQVSHSTRQAANSALKGGCHCGNDRRHFVEYQLPDIDWSRAISKGNVAKVSLTPIL